MRAFFLAPPVVFLAVLLGALVAPPAAAADGDASSEGYVMVQQALSFLVSDPDPEGVTQAMMKVDDALAAADQEGVAVDQVRQGKAALEAGDGAQARLLLQDSIAAAVSALRPAVGTETGTSIVLGPLPSRATLTGLDWAFLGLSLLMVLGGAALAVRFRPQESLRDLRHELRPHRAP